MRFAVISDIHGNLEAFDAVLADIHVQRADEIISLGDIIGYGPDPEPVVQKVRELKIPSVMGNHELAVSDRKNLEWFNPIARESLEKTITFLSHDSLQYVSELPKFMVMHGCRFVHGFPPDLVRTYLFQVPDDKLDQAMKKMTEDICFIGHTHLLELIQFDGKEAEKGPLKKGETAFVPDMRYLINIGSVGQPRDGNNNAKYVLWDTDENKLELRYVPYDFETVVDRIIAKGLPEAHAKRLR